MSFLEPKDLCVGKLYKLIETVEGHQFPSGDYFLVSLKSLEKENFPILGFSKQKKGGAEIFLKVAYAQFGDPTWRRAFFSTDNHWYAYGGPAGTRTWNFSYVQVEAITEVSEG